jgi:hypothetical protein
VFHLLGAKNSYYLNSQWQGTLQNERKRNMLRCAFWQDDFAFAKYLRSLEAFLYAHTEQESLLHEARSAAIAELFYSPNANYREGHTLLHSACGQQRKADLVTFYVAFYEPVERVEAKVIALLKAGADVTVQEEGKTLTEIALEYKVPDKVGDRYFPESVDRFVALLQEAAKVTE